MLESYQGHARRLAWLDGLRGCAIAGVVLVHAAQVAAPGSALRSVFAFGQYGVQLFFVISALTCILTLRGEESISNWYIKRATRIAVVYYFGLLMYFPIFKIEANLGIHDPGFSSPLNILANILFLHGWVPTANNTVVPGGWSIAVEMTFYAIAPAVIFLLLARPKWAAVVCGLSSVFLMILNYYLNGDVKNNTFEYFWPVNQLPIFLWTICLVAVANINGWDVWAEEGGHKFSLFVGMLILLFGCYLGVGSDSSHIVAPSLVGSGFFIIVASAGQFKRWFSGRYLVALGRISFSLYIVHFAFEHAVRFLFSKKFKFDLEHPLVVIFGMSLIVVGSIVCARFVNLFVEDKYYPISYKLIMLKNKIFNDLKDQTRR